MPKADRFGLVVVIASLLAIAAIVLTLFHNEQDRRLVEIRGQGVSLVRAMSAIPWEDYVSPDGDRGVMQVLRYSSVDNAIAFGSFGSVS